MRARCPPLDSASADGVHGRAADPSPLGSQDPRSGRETRVSSSLQASVARPLLREWEVQCGAADREADMSTNAAFVTDPAQGGLSSWRRAGLAVGELAHVAAPAAATGTVCILGSSAALRRVMERVARVAPTTATVLITGETGTGKELIARAIHAASPRAKRPLVRVNCAALPEGLLASELFGHERGAFTGALERRKGRFELASGGTIFLDEIGELSPAMQVALLRVLQEGEFERVGGTETLRTDVRVVAATNCNLEEAVRQGRFRADLLFRLNVVPIAVPPLREREDDIRLIAEHHARHYASAIGKHVAGLSAMALATLEAYPWPGNVRELQNVVERAVILTRHEVLEPALFELPFSVEAAPTAEPKDARARIEHALRGARGRVGGLDGAAASLGVSPSTLDSRIRRLGIDKHAFRPGPTVRAGVPEALPN
jgi:formate hydrogenlyase transcriptional activator